MIAATKAGSTLDQAIEAIGVYIREKKLEPGNRFPPEHLIAGELGISRTILREALRHYRTLGIIDSKPKVGSIIANLIPVNPYAGYLPFMEDGDEILNELGQMRAGLEIGMAPAMAANATTRQIDKLARLCDEMEASDAATAHEYDLESKFHSDLFRCANNRILNGQIPLLVDFFSKLYRRRRLNRSVFNPAPALIAEVNRSHRDIVEALRRRDGDWLVELLKDHSIGYVWDWDKVDDYIDEHYRKG